MAHQPVRPQTLRETLTETRAPAGGLVQYVRDVWGELRKVVWPSRQDATRLTVLVIAISVAVGIFLGLLDLGFNELFSQVILVVSGG